MPNFEDLKWIDITLPIQADYPSWPGDTPFSIIHNTKTDKGVNVNISTIQTSCHFGTHIDAPKHFIDEGPTIETMALDMLIGPCRVYQLDCPKVISESDLRDLDFDQVQRVLFKTANSQRINDSQFHRDYIGLDVSASQFLLNKRIRLIGTDYYSVAAPGQAAPVHQMLLGSNVVLLEGLDLGNVTQGDYQLLALPMKIVGSDGAPARVLLGR